jgi:hypothetical protein
MSDQQDVQPSEVNQATNIQAVRGYRWLVYSSWLLIIIVCIFSFVPAIGFAWLLVIPVFIATFIMAVITTKRGGNVAGVILLIVSLVGPVVILLARVATAHVESAAKEAAKEDLFMGMIVTTENGKQLSEMDKEAIQNHMNYWKCKRIGKSYYIRALVHDVVSTGKYVTLYMEMRNPKIQVKPYHLSQSDALNGVEWFGEMECSYILRTCNESNGYSWDKWNEDFHTEQWTKSKGVWRHSFTGMDENEITIKEVNESELPKGE